MKITEAKINWHHGFANDPTLEIKAENVPEFAEDVPIWTLQENGVVWTEKDCVVKYMYVGNGINNGSGMKGFGGRHFKIALKDGRHIETNDAWSSRAECVTGIECVEATINGRSSAITKELHEYLVCYVLEQYIVPVVRDTLNGKKIDLEISCSSLQYRKPDPDRVVAHKVNLNINVCSALRSAS